MNIKDPKTGERAKVPMYKVWAGMEEIYKSGKAKTIGISNFNVQLTLDLLTYAEIKPAVNQIELHPYLPQVDAVEWFKKQEIIPVAYSPFVAHGNDAIHPDGKKKVLDDPLLGELATKYNKTKGQIALNWGLQRGHVVIPKSSNKGRQNENLDCYSFKLEKEDVDKITALACGFRNADTKHMAFADFTPLYD